MKMSIRGVQGEFDSLSDSLNGGVFAQKILGGGLIPAPVFFFHRMGAFTKARTQIVSGKYENQ
jgi:hypothetical protein